MNIIYPKIPLKLLPAMLAYATCGGLLAGIYGVLHDQITYSISREYFTNLKFDQFAWADFGLPRQLFVSEIGFLATWWVGFFAAWLLARIAVPALPAKLALRHTLRGFAIVLACGFTGGLVGYVLGLIRLTNSDFSSWEGFRWCYDLTDLPSFVRVAYIHNAGYLGGLAGAIIAILYVRRIKHRYQADQNQSGVCEASR